MPCRMAQRGFQSKGITVNTHTHTHSSFSRTAYGSALRATASSAGQSLLSRITGGWQAWQRARRLRRDEADFRRIDAGTLRDLGMSPSEHVSFWAEAEGMAPLSRERVIRGQRQGGGR